MVETKQVTSRIEKVYIALLLIIFGGIVLHAPLTVALGTLWPDAEHFVKAWKEVLMAVALVLAGVILIRRRRVRLLKDPLLLAVAIYAALHLVLIPFSATPASSISAGLMIDLRYLLFFVLVYLALKLQPSYFRLFLKVGIAGALVVLTFALLQVFVLPPDFLKYLGYSNDTIAPYLTVDQNIEFIRINSTLRGPNPVGAYAVIALSLLAAKVVSVKRFRLLSWQLWLTLGGVVALWASYSRSAWGAAVVALAIVGGLTLTRTASARRLAIIGAVSAVIIGLGLFLARDTSFVSNIILHENPGESNNINSNEGHLVSLQESTEKVIGYPFGAGIGSTGSASLFSDYGLIIENQYLFIAHEVGWLGLGLFAVIFLVIIYRLWLRRRSWFALGVLASGVGMAIIGFVLPVWADDTIAIVWWGLAAMAISQYPRPAELSEGEIGGNQVN